MKRSLTAIGITVSLFIGSCKSADRNDDGQMAIEYCKCFDKLVSRLSEDTKKMVIDAGKASDPRKFLLEYKNSLSDEKYRLVDQEMGSMRVTGTNNPDVLRCLDKVQVKYSGQYNMNEESTLQKIIRVLEKKQACLFTASMLKMGLKNKSGSE